MCILLNSNQRPKVIAVDENMKKNPFYFDLCIYILASNVDILSFSSYDADRGELAHYKLCHDSFCVVNINNPSKGPSTIQAIHI